MRLPPRRPLTAQINMTPMIDVTFQLIIFFLLSSRLAQQEAVEIALPEAISSTQASDNRPRLSVNVSPDGRVFFGNAEAPPREMARLLRGQRDRVGSDVEVRIRADRSVPYRFVEPILLACAEADIWNVTFAVLERVEVKD